MPWVPQRRRAGGSPLSAGAALGSAAAGRSSRIWVRRPSFSLSSRC